MGERKPKQPGVTAQNDAEKRLDKGEYDSSEEEQISFDCMKFNLRHRVLAHWLAAFRTIRTWVHRRDEKNKALAEELRAKRVISFFGRALALLLLLLPGTSRAADPGDPRSAAKLTWLDVG